MAIINRSLDSSEQKQTFVFFNPRFNDTTGVSNTVITGVTCVFAMVPFAGGVLESVRYLAQGVSNSMQVQPLILRNTSGGVTLINPSISNMVLQNLSVSGIVGYSGLAATGSTLLQLQVGDGLAFATSVANASAQQLVLEFVVKKTADITQTFGIS